jgi:hypothetical protein
MMIQELNPVSSPDQAGLKTLEKPGFLTPSQLAVAQLRDKSTTRELYLRPGDILHSAFSIRSFKGTARPDASGITHTTIPYLGYPSVKSKSQQKPSVPFVSSVPSFPAITDEAHPFASLDHFSTTANPQNHTKKPVSSRKFTFQHSAIGYRLSAI